MFSKQLTSKMVKSVCATEKISDLQSLFSIAIKEANSKTVDGVDRCFDILCYLKNLSFSSKDLVRLSKQISSLASLRDHKNPTIRVSAKALFNSWMKTMYSGGGIRDPSTCNNTKLLKKPAADSFVKVCPVLKKKKKKKFKRSVTTCGVAAETTKKTEFLGLDKTENQRSRVHEVTENKQHNLNKADAQKPLAAKKPIEEKKHSARPMKLSENPRSLAHEAVEIKQQESVPPVKNNSTETLELFDIAKRSADVASARGILLSTKETAICVDTLSLLIDYPISSTAPETKRIMEKLSYLTNHKDRKICNSAAALLQHWSQSITDQQQG